MYQSNSDTKRVETGGKPTGPFHATRDLAGNTLLLLDRSEHASEKCKTAQRLRTRNYRCHSLKEDVLFNLGYSSTVGD